MPFFFFFFFENRTIYIFDDDSLWHTVILLSLPRIINLRKNFLHLFAYTSSCGQVSYVFDEYFSVTRRDA